MCPLSSLLKRGNIQFVVCDVPKVTGKSVAKLALGLRAQDFVHCTSLKVTWGFKERSADRNVQVIICFTLGGQALESRDSNFLSSPII